MIARILVALAVTLSALSPLPAVGYTFSLPKCWPAEFVLGATGQGFQTWDPQDGTGICRAGWWCPMPDGRWESYTHCTIARYKDASWQLYWSRASKLPLTDAAASMLQALQVAPATQAETDVLDSLMHRFVAVLQSSRPADVVMAPPPPPPPPSPPPPAWVVDAPTAADGTRPAYPLVNGVRSKTSTARAASGQPCRPEVAQSPSDVAGKVFAAFGPAFADNMVALCKRP